MIYTYPSINPLDSTLWGWRGKVRIWIEKQL